MLAFGRSRWAVVAFALVAVFLLAGCRQADADPSMPAGATEGPLVTVYKTPTCGCCGAWVERMREAGFQVREVNLSAPALVQMKVKYGVPQDLYSCHTAIVEDYVVEGHVPPQEVQRLLSERPPVKGVAVPGMPTGAPGMESPSGLVQPYTVFTFDEEGNVQPIAQYP